MDDRDLPYPSLWKQLLGAGIGAGVALLLYGAYSTVTPHISAWLIAPQSQIVAQNPGGVATATVDMPVAQYERLAAKSKAVYQRLAAQDLSPAQNDGQTVTVPGPLQTPPSFPPSPPLVVSEVQSSSSQNSLPLQNDTTVPAVQRSAQRREERIQKMAGERLPSSGIGTTLVLLTAGMFAGVRTVRSRKERNL
ncbi:MAG: hypothetical protein WCG83_00380 [Candidatus Peregrinibacteria bacterium]